MAESPHEIEEGIKASGELLRQGVYDCVMSWASLEMAMSELLDGMLEPKKEIGHSIFFALKNAEARFDVVDAVVAKILIQNKLKVPERVSEVQAAWKGLIKNIHKARTRRNAIMHSSVVSSSGPKKHEIRLFPLLHDEVRIKKQSKGGAVPGLSAEKVAQTSQHFWGLGKCIRAFLSVMWALQGRRATFQKKFRELEDHRHYLLGLP